MSTDFNKAINKKCNVNALSDSRVVCWRTRTTKSLGAFLQVFSPNMTKILLFSSNPKHTQLTDTNTASEFILIFLL